MTAAAALIAMFGVAFQAHAQNVITDPSASFSVGIDPSGALYDDSPVVGFRRLSDGYDPLAPGTPRDSVGCRDQFGLGLGGPIRLWEQQLDDDRFYVGWCK